MVLPAVDSANTCESSCGDEDDKEEVGQECETKLECKGGVCSLRRRCVPKMEVGATATAEHVKAN
eukprot:CAMPEP_0184691680 /NCGR_PEP_ID=MMETSP0313-20130426/452_1 /TAXON_ID=2792 /ORGANISM="Porphyridium aerugineum, Strain SAG 1380-2" /LENGTH=64 /DNA_ID=CAMNT_0027149435 /DNA_START=403 /DNA_END=597 /DNA_ORIENTATION=+